MVKSEGDEVRGGMPQSMGEIGLPPSLRIAAAGRLPQSMGEIGLPPSLRIAAAGRLPQIAECVEDGRRRSAPAQRAAIKVNEVDGVPANHLVEAAQAEARRSALISCIPPAREHCLEKGLDGLDPDDQHPDELRAWLEDPDALTLILAGPPGNGKTEAGYAALVHAGTVGAAMHAKRRHGPRLVRAFDVNTYIAALRPDGAAEPAWKLRDRAYTAEVLFGDDLGAELDSVEMTAFMRDELARLQTYRLEHKLRTIWSTNRRGPVLQTMVGSRMWSRLHEQATAITFTGEDRRKLSALDW
jgi:hypothetical protein